MKISCILLTCMKRLCKLSYPYLLYPFIQYQYLSYPLLSYLSRKKVFEGVWGNFLQKVSPTASPKFKKHIDKHTHLRYNNTIYDIS